MPPSKQKSYSPPPKNKLVIENRIIDGKKRKVETYNGKVARVYDDDWKLLEDRSEKLKVTLPTPPLVPRVRQGNKLDDTSPQEDKPKEEPPILDIPYLSSTSTQIDEKMMSGTGGGLQLVPEDDVAKPGYIEDIPKEENVEVPKVEEIPKEENVEVPKVEDIPKEENVEVPKVEEIPKSEPPKVEEIPKSEPPKVEEILKIEGNINSGLSQQLDKVINIQDISNKVDIPKVEPQKEAPKVEILKGTPKKTNIKEAQEMGIPGVPIKKTENRIEKLIDKKTPSTQTITTNDKPKVEDKIIEATKAGKKPIEDKITKENKNMVEELLEEYKREQWAKKRDFEKNIEDMARVASENKGQIKEISQKIEGVSGKVGEVEEKIGGLQDNFQEKIGGLQENFQEKFGTLQENLQERLGNVKKPVSDALGELCTGVDCIKTDLKKSQEYQRLSEKQLEGKFQELSERLQKLEEPTFVCDNCGQDNIRPLSSFCPNCGAPIHSWTDPETGMPIVGWSPYWKRSLGKQIEY